MTTEPNFRALAEKLLLRTQKGEVNWAEEEPDKSGTAFAVKLPKAGIVVKLVTPIADPDYLVLALLDEKGHAVTAWQVDDPEGVAAKPQVSDWDLLHSLYNEARRRATGWDKIFKEVESALAGQGPIGLAPQRK